MEENKSRSSRHAKKKQKPAMNPKKLLRLVIIVAACVAAVLIFMFAIYPQITGLPVEEEKKETQEAAEELEDISGVTLDGLKIIVDAGHGGDDIGCIGVNTGRYEKEVNLEIAKKLEALLTANGAHVVMTRETDNAIAPTKEEDMQARENIILTEQADMFISIHQNEFTNEEASGPQLFFVEQGSVGKRLAVAIQEMMNNRLGIEEGRMALPQAYRLLKPGAQPSCIVECGFFSNPEEEKLLQDDAYQQKLADAITDGVKLYVKRFLME